MPIWQFAQWHIGIFSPVLDYCAKKNLATLQRRQQKRQKKSSDEIKKNEIKWTRCHRLGWVAIWGSL
jgi:hypothetical protein